MKGIVQYKLRPLPSAQAKPNGKTRSSAKNTLIYTLVKESPLVHSLSQNTIKIFDAIVLIQ